MFDFIDGLDKQAVEGFLVSLHSSTLNDVAYFISQVWPHTIWFGLFMALALYQNWRRAAVFLIMLGTAILIAGTAADLLKNWVGRPRPLTYIGVALDLSRDSFPSAHATNSFAVAFMINYYYRSIGFFVTVVALAVALSRVVQLLHYPSDVVFGALLACSLGALQMMLVLKICRHKGFEKALIYFTPAGKKKPPPAAVTTDAEPT